MWMNRAKSTSIVKSKVGKNAFPLLLFPGPIQTALAVILLLAMIIGFRLRRRSRRTSEL